MLYLFLRHREDGLQFVRRHLSPKVDFAELPDLLGYMRSPECIPSKA